MVKTSSVYTVDMVEPDLDVSNVLKKIDELYEKFSLPPIDRESPKFRKSLSDSFRAFVFAPEYVEITRDMPTLTLNIIAEHAPISVATRNWIYKTNDLTVNEIDVSGLPFKSQNDFKGLSASGLRDLIFTIAISQALNELEMKPNQPTKSNASEIEISYTEHAASCAGRMLLKIGANPTLAEAGAKLLADALEKFAKLEAVQLKV